MRRVHLATIGDCAVPRFGIFRGSRQLDYADLVSELPIALWPLPHSDTYGVRENAAAAVRALNLRQARIAEAAA